MFLSQEEALTRAKALGCLGTTHRHASRHMPCANHEEYTRRLGITP
ncbi:gibberellin regulated-like protein [bacterium]|nr:gibberellin regulated-like protein [bacterium]